jgi:hypothetical protein
MKTGVWRLVLEYYPAGKTMSTSRMIVRADTKEETVKGLQKIFTGEISMKDIPKTGLDLTNKPESGLVNE